MLFTINTIYAGSGVKFSASLDGNQEVSSVETEGNGLASFQLKGNSISYQINAMNTYKITEIHIHKGIIGENGDVIVSLYSPDDIDKVDVSPLLDKLRGKLMYHPILNDQVNSL